MICPRCQSQVADGTKFCGVCGSPMNVGAQPTPPPPPSQPSQYGAPGQYGSQMPDGGFIPPNQFEEYSNNSVFGAQVPKTVLHNPKNPLKVSSMIIYINFQLATVVD